MEFAPQKFMKMPVTVQEEVSGRHNVQRNPNETNKLERSL